MTPDVSQRATGQAVQLMATCLCDAFFADTARATVEVLEHAGCSVEFPERQTCCGQPAFNGGDWDSSRRVVEHTLKVFAGDKPVIVPSGSCAAMVFHGSPLQFEKHPSLPAVQQMAGRTWELFDYLVNGLGVTSWPGHFEARVAIHHSCHTRGSGTGAALLQLLESIEGVELVEVTERDQCCGFGGTFSVAFPEISKSMGCIKIEHLLKNTPDYVVSADMSCLMHLKGLAEKQDRPMHIWHAAQILSAALANR
ncbi:MAG: (Fe-S)-binding protein [Opitutales bacterium]